MPVIQNVFFHGLSWVLVVLVFGVTIFRLFKKAFKFAIFLMIIGGVGALFSLMHWVLEWF